MYKFYSIYLVFLCFLIACVSRGEYSQTELRELENDVIRHDDKGSYSLLRVYYGTDSISHKLLPYSLKMVKDSKTGCYDFYFNYLKLRFENKFDHKNILKLEKSEQDFLIFLIRKGA
nr:hypothetical protein [Cyclobacteriaceae bacterium]